MREDETSQQRTESRGAGVTLLEQGLWKRLASAEGRDDIGQAWAPLMFAMLDEPDVCAVFLRDDDTLRLRQIAVWPESRVPGEAIVTAAENCIAQGRGIVRGEMPKDGGGGKVAVATPITVDGMTVGVAAFEGWLPDQTTLQSTMRRLQWGAAWIRDAERARLSDKQSRRYAHAVSALHTITTAAEQQEFQSAIQAAVTDLATRYDCDRASIGFKRLGRTKVQAISHTAQFGRQMQLVRQLGAAMDEAIDQRGVVIYPEPEGVSEPMATHRHERLARAQSIGHVLTVPLFVRDKFVGGITFERPAERPFSQDEAEILEATVTVLAPILEEARRNDRYIITRIGDWGRRQLAELLGPSRLFRKTLFLGALFLALFFWVAETTDRIPADARVEAELQRAVVAPYDGFIAEASVRAGDVFEEGQLLARLDDREPVLERLRLLAEKQRAEIEYDQALAASDRSEAQVQRNRIDQFDAQIALVDKQIERARLVAPFDGIVVAGDLSQSIGGAVVRGQELLTLVPGEGYRIAMQVEERRIGDVSTGQAGSLVVAALPDQSFPLEVVKITPVANYGEGRTTYRVEAVPAGNADLLLPGMEGVAKLDAGSERVIAIWTRPMRDWLRLWSWRWLGLGADEG